MTRIAGVPESKAGLLARFAYRYSRRHFGKVAEPLAVSAHHTWTLLGYSAFEWAVARSGTVDTRIKELAALKAATLVGCPF